MVEGRKIGAFKFRTDIQSWNTSVKKVELAQEEPPCEKSPKVDLPKSFECYEDPSIYVRSIYRHPDVPEEQRKHLLKYTHRCDKLGRVKCTYDRAFPFGRFQPSNGLCAATMKKSVRSTLFSQKCLDLDIVNAQPSLLLKDLKSTSVDPAAYDWLAAYVKNRDAFISKTLNMTHSKGKNFIISVCLFGQSIDNWTQDNGVEPDAETEDILHTLARRSSRLRDKLLSWIRTNKPDVDELLNNAADFTWNKKKEKKKAEGEQSYGRKQLSKFSWYLQELEVREVWAAMEELRARDVDVMSYCYDGFLVSKDHQVKVDVWLKSKRTSEIKWIIKEWSSVLHEEGFAEPFSAVTFHSKETFTEKLNYFQSYFCFISHQSLILMETPSSNSSYVLYTISTARANFTNLYHEFEVEVKGETIMKKKGMINYWLEMPDRRQYDTLEFDPDGVAGPRVYNLWRGFPIERFELLNGDEYSTAPIHAHMKHLMENNDAGYEYLLKYLAHLVQYPGVKPGVAFLMTGPEGGGKSTFFSLLFQALVGELHMLQTAKADDIVGRFNQVGEKLVVIWEETSGRDSWTNANLVKTLVTEERQAIEKKGKDAVVMKIPTRLFFFSNEDAGKPIKISESDRRFVAVRTLVPKDKHSYFTHLFGKVMSCPFTIRRFFEELRTTDISNFNPARDRYIGEFYKELQKDCSDIVAQFWEELCDSVHSEDKRFYLSNLDEEGIDMAPLANGESIACMDVYDWFSKWAVRMQRVDKDKLHGSREFCRKLKIRYSTHVTQKKETSRSNGLRNKQVFIFNDIPEMNELE